MTAFTPIVAGFVRFSPLFLDCAFWIPLCCGLQISGVCTGVLSGWWPVLCGPGRGYRWSCGFRWFRFVALKLLFAITDLCVTMKKIEFRTNCQSFIGIVIWPLSVG